MRHSGKAVRRSDGKIYRSIVEAAEDVGCSPSVIGKVCKDKYKHKKSAKGFGWAYYTPTRRVPMTFVTTNVLLTSDRGITSSEANHIANVAKERVSDGDRMLSTVTTLERRLHLPSGEMVDLTDRNYNAATVQTVIETRARLYPLVAVLRAAIKVRQKMLADIEQAQAPGMIEATLPPRPELLPQPEIPSMGLEVAPVTDAWGIDQLSYKQRADMLAAEARAAAYGAYLHNEGELARLNSELAEKRARKTPEGTVTVSYPKDNEVSEQFLAVQQLHREAEKRLNMYRSMIHDKVNERNREINEQNLVTRREAEQVEMQHQHAVQQVAAENHKIQTDWKLECQRLESERQAAYQTHVAQFELDRKHARIAVAALKIQVPAELQDVFDELKGE